MESSSYNDKKLEAYLRNELSDAEIAVLEDELLRDEELFQRLQTAEMNLIDRYLEKEMTDEENARFEATFASNPANEWKIEEARVFRESLEALRDKDPPRNVEAFPIPAKGFFHSLRFRQMAAAAALLIVLAGVIALAIIRSGERNLPDKLTRMSTGPVPSPSIERLPGSGGNTVSGEQNSQAPNESPKRRTDPVQQEWLYLRDADTGVMGPDDDLPITVLPDTEMLRLRFELVGEAATRHELRVSIKDAMGYPVFPSLRTVETSSVRYRGLVRRVIWIDVPLTQLKLGERYRFEILEPYAHRVFVLNGPARR